jgi:hypothetical protein
MSEQLKKDLKVLAEAQLAFELNNWKNTGTAQKIPYSNSSMYGTIYEKGDKKFYLNIESATKALQLLQRSA